VSCVSSSACVAVGSGVNDRANRIAIAASWNGTAWSAQHPPQVRGAAGAALAAVSCVATDDCTLRSASSSAARRSPSRWWNGGTAAPGTWSLHPREEVARSRESPARAQTAALRLAPPATPRARPSLWPNDGMVRAGRSCRRRRCQMRPSRCFLPFRARPPARAPQSGRRLRPGLGLWRNDGTAARPSRGTEPVGHCNPALMSRAQS
jgi:hypothetical protein